LPSNELLLAECYYTFPEKMLKSKQSYKKFIGADKLIRHLAYLMKICPERQFSVIYEDRFVG